MPVESVKNNPNKLANIQLNKLPVKQQTFTGSLNPIVTLMDAIDRGGFAASFIAQDGIGMVAPRIYEGLNRNRKKDENGKKTGPLNWEFARREGIREVLSGPSAFLIPMAIMAVIKKLSGTANNVYTSHIDALGKIFAQHASENPESLNNITTFKKGYYTQVFKNVLSESTEKNMTADILEKEAANFTEELMNAEIKDKKTAKKIINKLTRRFMDLRKAYTDSTNNELEAIVDNGKIKKLHTTIKRLLPSMTDYTNDAFAKTVKHVKNGNAEQIKAYVSKFNMHRAGTRVLSNLGMWSAVVGFYALIPKLYNLGLKHDPGLKGLEEQNNNENKDKKDVTFTGNLFSKVGETAIKDGNLNKILSNFEFNGASMPVNAMLTLLFGFTLPTRYSNAKSDKERKEIIVRDITSFTAILFAAKALSRGFSKMFSKISGFALNITPQNHKGLFNKFKNYFTAGSGIEVLTTEQIVSKYSKIENYKDGINGFFKFINENGGNVKKFLNSDKTVRENSDKILRQYCGKSLKKASLEDIDNAFKQARLAGNCQPLENIRTAFATTDNKFVNMAKTFNSAFGFASTLILVPAFMMWLARYCEKMTKKAVAKEKEQEQKNFEATIKEQNIVLTNKPTMAGFLNR